MTPLAIIQARMGSTRLPGKVMLRLGGKPVLQHVIERTRRAVERVVVAIPDTAENDVLDELCGRLSVYVTRGSELDVLARFQKAVREHPCDYVIRVTADCPLVEPVILRLIMAEMEYGSLSYCNMTWHKRVVPDGVGAEAIRAEALIDPFVEFTDEDREHVTPWCYRGHLMPAPVLDRWIVCPPQGGPPVTSWTVAWPSAPVAYRRHYRLTLDTWDDYAHLCMLWALLSKGGEAPATLDVLRWLDEHPQAVRINERRSPLLGVERG